MATPATRVFRRLEGLFSVYKPPGVHWKLVRDTIETNLLKGINSEPSLPSPSSPQLVKLSPQLVKLLAEPSGAKNPSTELTISAARVTALATHSLVCAPEFQHIKVGVGHRLDAFSSGVLVLAVGNGNKALNELYKSRVTRDYTLEGEFGTATDTFCHTGRVWERTTYDHITQDKLERVLAMLQGANQKALLMYSSVDMQSQEAYEMVVQGSLGPDGKSAPIITGLRCIRFQPPHFTLEIQCFNETQKYLCKLVHEIGLELRSTAVCKGVRRTRDGPFTLQGALIRHQWTASDVELAVKLHHLEQRGPNTELNAMQPNAAS